MAEIRIDLNEIEELAYGLGLIYAAVRRGFTEGIRESDFIKDVEATHTVSDEDDNAAFEAAIAKTEINDCLRCWCNACTKLETCERHLDGIVTESEPGRPTPCTGCRNGMRFKPSEEPACEEFERGQGWNYG